MKRFLSLILAAVMVLSLAACGGGNEAPQGNASAPAADAPATEEAPEEEAAVPGTYEPVGLIPGDAYTLNENGSYDHGEEKGTYTADENGSRIETKSKDGSASCTLTACGAYYHTGTKMTEDTEYGLAPSFDESGHSNQAFKVNMGETSLALELHEDGSFAFSYSKASPVHDKLTDVVSYEGTYTLEDTILNLDWSGNTFPFLVADDAIYPVVYTKKTDANSAGIETAQAAVQTAEADAAQGRWWTPADEAVSAGLKEALAGTWEYSDGYGLYQLTFTDTDVSVHMSFMGQAVLNSTGTYEILNGAIRLSYKSTSGQYTIINARAVPYTYTDGSLALYEMLDIMNEEALLDPAVDFTSVSSYQYQKIS